MDCYINPKASVKHINEYYEKCRAANEEIHTLQIWQGDELMVRIAPEPYECSQKREIYSLSKTFCSTAIGVACDEGLISSDTLVCDIFPDKLPSVISPNLAKMRLSHVLSMNTGHDNCVMRHMISADDPVSAFLSLPVEHAPGTHFAYNTGATFFLSAVIKKVTGENLIDYLNRKILFPLGIKGVYWNTASGERLNEGGIGLHASSDDIAAFGRLYLNKGMWQGKRLLSEEWIEKASSFVSDNSSNGNPDWCSGYGYQIWMMKDGGYRGDGAFGQLMIVLPEKNRVISVQGITVSMQDEIDRVLYLAEHLADDTDATEPFIPSFPVVTPSQPAEICDLWYRPEENIFGWTMLHLYVGEDCTLNIDFSNGKSVDHFEAGFGRYTFSEGEYIWRKPKLFGLMDARLPEKIATAASYTVKDGSIVITSRHLCDPHTETITLRKDGDKLTLSFLMPDLLDERARSLACLRLSQGEG